MDRQLNDFNIKYSVNLLLSMYDDINTLQRKLDPSNFDSADTHLSIEEKYKIRALLSDVKVHIAMLSNEVECPTGEEKPKSRIHRLIRKK